MLAYIDERLAQSRFDGFRYADMPKDDEAWRLAAQGLDEAAQERGHQSYARAPQELRSELCGTFAEGRAPGGQAWSRLPPQRAWKVLMRYVLSAFYAHPWAWNEIGFPGRYSRLGAGYTPRFHPSDFRTMTLDGVGTDWPIAYEDLRGHYERVELELPVSGQWWPWGDPHGYPHTPHPVSGGALTTWRGARRLGIEMKVGPVGITNGTFGNRPHCIYRGFCLQGCKVNAKASPLITHVPDAIAHGAEIRANCFAVAIETDDAGACTGVRYLSDGVERL